MVIASLRDLVGEDANQFPVTSPNSNKSVAQALREDPNFEVVMAVNDDSFQKMDAMGWHIPWSPEIPYKWMPADFLKVPKQLRTPECMTALKYIWEERVWELAKKIGAHVVLLDHLMWGLEHLFSLMPGCVLNIHPAPTDETQEFHFRGKTPTADAIRLARARNSMPDDVKVRTGATIHYVIREIDAGRIIHCLVGTPVYATDDPSTLRCRNYPTKHLVAAQGIKLWAGV